MDRRARHGRGKVVTVSLQISGAIGQGMLRDGERGARLVVWAVFTAIVVRVCWGLPAWDLTATYVAGRLVASATRQHGLVPLGPKPPVRAA